MSAPELATMTRAMVLVAVTLVGCTSVPTRDCSHCPDMVGRNSLAAVFTVPGNLGMGPPTD